MSLLRVTAVTMFLASTIGVADTLSAQPGRGNDRRNDDGRDRGRTLFTWNGVVDREVTLVMRGNDLTVRGERDIYASRRERPRTTGALPRTDGDVRVRVLDGRGQVIVLQQPNSRNNYTTIVRVRDPQGGSDRYRIAASWEPEARYGNNGNGNGNGKAKGKGKGNRERGDDRDDEWGRDRDGRDRNYPQRDGDWDRDGDRGRDGDWERDDDRRNDDRRNDDRRNDDRRNEGLRWSGVIDDVVELRVQGRRVDVIERSGARTRDARSSFSGALPRESVSVQLARVAGRGAVRIVQQPSIWNAFTAVIRIEDRSGGAARYDVDLRW